MSIVCANKRTMSNGNVSPIGLPESWFDTFRWLVMFFQSRRFQRLPIGEMKVCVARDRDVSRFLVAKNSHHGLGGKLGSGRTLVKGCQNRVVFLGISSPAEGL